MSQPSLTQRCLPILLIHMIGAMSYGIVLPTLPYYAEKFKATPIEIGLLSSIYALCAFFAAPIFGALSDRVGRKPLLVISLFGTALGFITMALAESLWQLFLGRAIDGLSGGNIVIANGVISDITNQNEKAKAYGLMGAAYGVGYIIGPFLGGVLGNIDLGLTFWAATSTIIICIAWLGLTPFAIFKPVSTYHSQPISSPPTNPKAAATSLFMAFACMVFALTLVVASFGLLMQRQIQSSIMLAGVPAIAFGLASILFQGMVIPKFPATISPQRLVLTGLGIMTLAMIGMSMVRSVSGAALVSMCLAIGLALSRPQFTALIAQFDGAQRTGKMLGLSYSLDSFAQMFAPALGGILIAQFSSPALSLVAAGVMASASLMFLLYCSQANKDFN